MAAPTKRHLRLNPLDHFAPSNYTFFCTYLPLQDGVTDKEVVRLLQKGLRRVFRQLPWLDGNVHFEDPATPGWRPGQLEVRYGVSEFNDDKPLRQVRVNHLDPEQLGGVGYEYLKQSGFPLSFFEDEQLAAAELLPRLEDGPDCFSCQINFLPGACLLVAATHHAVCDGLGSFEVWRLWAAHCNALQGGPVPVPSPTPESSDRTLLDRIWAEEGSGLPADQVGDESWNLLDLQRPGEPPPDAPESLKTLLSDSSMPSVVFYMSPDKLAELQRSCREDDSVGTAYLSANDALAALIWRCMLRAKKLAAANTADHNQPSAPPPSSGQARLFLTVDARAGISRQMPLVYFGNGYLINICATDLETLTSPNTSVGTIARLIRSVADRATPTAMLDAYTLAREVKDLSELRLKRGHTPGSLDMVLSSFLMYPVDGVSWGEGPTSLFADGGRPDAVRPLMRRFDRASQVCFVMPRKTFGGVEFVLNLFPDEMRLLLQDEEFGRWALHYCD